MDPHRLSPAALDFLSERHHASLATLRADGSPHVVPVGFTFDLDRAMVRVITFRAAVKTRNAARGGRVAVTQIDGARWLTFEGASCVTDDPATVAAAVAAYARRYRQPAERADRVVIEIAVDRLMGSRSLQPADLPPD